ncbi:MAG: phytanoyl-CoA dioxygenase family protein [Aureisphaera sp.]
MDVSAAITSLKRHGFAIIPGFYSDSELKKVADCLKSKGKQNTHEDSKSLFAIRQLLHNIPELKSLLSTNNLKKLLAEFSEKPLYLTKAIYFDKPKASNWFVPYHQDLSISVKNKVELDGYTNWTFKKGQYGVIPPQVILEDTLTVRIHLDDTYSENGALKVLPKSHLKGIQRSDKLGISQESEVVCEVPKGGVMLMQPLTMHASHRTTNGKRRRVIHLEFCSRALDKPLEWLEG